MVDSPPAAIVMTKSDLELASVLPIGLIEPSNLLWARELPFNTYEIPDELQVSLERTKQRWAWFSKAKDHDKERGTQLGTLGYFPWEIRQKIFRNIFDGFFTVREVCSRWFCFSESGGNGPCRRETIPYSWRDLAIRNVSASIRSEVEHAFITMAHFEFMSDKRLNIFLDHLTTYEKSLLRSVKIPIHSGPLLKLESERVMASCARLPSGLTSIIFEFTHCKVVTEPTEALELVDSFNLLGKQVRRCWTPRAKISIDNHFWGCLSSSHDRDYPFECQRQIVASAFSDLEPWSQGWLDWWASSRNHDQAEEQCSPLKDKIDESQGTGRDIEEMEPSA